MPSARHGPWRVYWRDRFGDTGSRGWATLEQAIGHARAFERSPCWAAVVHPTKSVFAFECGIRFADLLRQRNAALQLVAPHRKPPAREAAQLRQGRAHG
jgi:hypothetical protein